MPSGKPNVRRCRLVIETRDTFDPRHGNAALRGSLFCIIGGANGIMHLLWDSLSRRQLGVRRERNALCWQAPGPFASDAKSMPDGSYAEILLCLYERFRMLNLLVFTKQSYRTRFYLKFGYGERARSERPQKKICYRHG